ncbi:endonuclease/exonuclease/phosphatase family protein [candidate division KSB1 bacterium]|nr:endonuclease/exonuclease/phosphatase family protein [candidate division KSB1 bacterium]
MHKRMIWLFYTLVEIFIWNCPVRAALVGERPVLHMAASILNDMLWLPLAITLPVYIILLYRRLFRGQIVRDISTFLFVVLCVTMLANIELLFRLQFVFLSVFFVLWAAYIRKSRTVSIELAFFSLALCGMIMHYRAQLLPSFAASPPGLSIMSFNINTRAALDDERTVQFIRKRFPDIVCLQEVTMHDQRIILQKLGDLYPFYLAPARGFGRNDVMILSRKEILYGDHIPLKTKSQHAVNHAVIRYDDRHINVINCHLHHAYRYLGELFTAPDAAGTYQMLSDAFSQQQEQAQALIAYARTLNGPTILTGDFNDTPNGTVYRLFDRSFDNAFAAAGWGLGATFGKWNIQTKLPDALAGFAFNSFRIDHVFLSREFEILTAQLHAIGAFDHVPQIITVVLK